MMTPRRSSGCGACIPELTTCRLRGRSQAPWTIVMLGRKPSQSIHTSTETYTFRRRSRMPCVFSWPPLLVGDTGEVVSSSATSSSTEFASTSLYSIYIRSCPQQTVCSTHTHTSTKLNCLQYYQLYSGLYLFEYCCSHLHSGTVHHAPSMDDFLHRACPWVMGHRRFVEGYDRASNRMVCTSILCSRLLSSDDTYRKQIFPHLRRITTRPAVPDYKSSHSCR